MCAPLKAWSCLLLSCQDQPRRGPDRLPDLPPKLGLLLFSHRPLLGPATARPPADCHQPKRHCRPCRPSARDRRDHPCWLRCALSQNSLAPLHSALSEHGRSQGIGWIALFPRLLPLRANRAQSRRRESDSLRQVLSIPRASSARHFLPIRPLKRCGGAAQLALPALLKALFGPHWVQAGWKR